MSPPHPEGSCRDVGAAEGHAGGGSAPAHRWSSAGAAPARGWSQGTHVPRRRGEAPRPGECAPGPANSVKQPLLTEETHRTAPHPQLCPLSAKAHAHSRLTLRDGSGSGALSCPGF